MSRGSVYFLTVSVLMLLFQWFVFVSVRKYLFSKDQSLGMKFVLSGIGILAILNIVAVRLVFNPEPLAPDTLAKQIVSVTYYSYIGYVLLLTVVFALIELVWLGWKITDRWLRRERHIPSGLRKNGKSEKDATKSDNSIDPGIEHETSARISVAEESLAQAPAMYSRIPVSPTRRTFLKWSAATGVVLATGYAGHGIAEAYQLPSIEEFDVYHPALRGINNSLTFLHITDVHFGLFLWSDELERLVDNLNGLDADGLILTGDIFHSSTTPVEKAIPILERLKPRRFGNIAVLGNHEFYAGERRSAEALVESGFTLLRNRWMTFRADGREFHIGGIDDPRKNWILGKTFPQISRFLEKAPHSGFRLLLSHRPQILPHAAEYGIDLILAGHTHGGQLIFPAPGAKRGLSMAGLVSEYTHGWYKEMGSRMYLNRGIGMSFLPWRINCSPEIALFRLKAPEGPETATVI
jgi:predicted MPP superfamily phosphohydrolase